MSDLTESLRMRCVCEGEPEPCGRCRQEFEAADRIDYLDQELAAARDRDVVSLWRDQYIPWSLRTFGEGMRTLGVTKHIEKELVEVRANPTDVMEWIDVALLALDGAWRSGHTAEEVFEAMRQKMQINLTRTYPMPTDDEPSEHVRDKARAAGGGG